MQCVRCGGRGWVWRAVDCLPPRRGTVEQIKRIRAPCECCDEGDKWELRDVTGNDVMIPDRAFTAKTDEDAFRIIRETVFLKKEDDV